MSKKPRENRVPIMMSDAELKSIDDWRFANRVATRSDAVRRLCQTGIVYTMDMHPVVEKTVEFLTPIFAMERGPMTTDERNMLFTDFITAVINTSTALMALKADSTDDAVEELVEKYEFYKQYEEQNPPPGDEVRIRPLHWRKPKGSTSGKN